MPQTYETEGGTTVVEPDSVEFEVSPITGVKPVTFSAIEGATIAGVDVVASSEASTAANLLRYQTAYKQGIDLAKSILPETTAASAQQIKDYVGAIAPFIRQQTGIDNRFNQEQRLQAVEFALPGARQTTLEAIDRAKTYASGRLISSIDDRAFEAVSRNMAADSTFMRGFGDDSVIGRKTSDIISAQDRLNLAMMGESSLQSWLQTGNTMFVDQPIKANIGAQIPGAPSFDAGQAMLQSAQGTAAILSNFNLISSSAQAEADLQTQMYNATNTLNTQMYNASTELEKQMFNANNALEVQMFNSGIALEGYYAAVADAQTEANAWQNAYNQEANLAALQMQLEAQQAGAMAGLLGSGIGALGTLAAAAIFAA